MHLLFLTHLSPTPTSFNPALFLGSCLFQLYGLITKFHLLNRTEGQWAELIFQPISAHFSWTFNSFQMSVVFQLRWCSSSCTKRTWRCWFRRSSTPHRASQCSPCSHMWLEPCGLSAPPREMLFQSLWWHELGACSLKLCSNYSVPSWLKKLNKKCPVPQLQDSADR